MVFKRVFLVGSVNMGLTCNAALSDLTIQFKPKMSVPAPMSPFAGPPSREVDLAWHTLLGNTSIRVSQEELNRNGNHNKSVALPRSEEHLAWLNVFHQLHCLVSQPSFSIHTFD